MPWFALPALGGNGAELPGEHRNRRARVVDRRAMRRGEGQEHAVFAPAQAIEIQPIDQLVRVADLDHLPQPFEHRAEFLEDEVIAVLGPPKILLDVALVGFRMNDDQHDAAPVSATTGTTSRTGSCLKNSASRCCTGAKLQYWCMRSLAASAMACQASG
ncbi:hypothetical protein D3C71_1404870 [compost metagenome]